MFVSRHWSRRQARAGGVLLTLALVSIQSAQADGLPMWEIRGDENTVTILGSIHFLRPDDPLPRAVVAAYDDAEAIVMELDLDDVDPLAAQGAIQRLGMDPQGRTLEKMLGQADWRRAQEKAQAMDLELALLNGFEPWLAAITITQLRLQQLGFEADYGVEQQILRRASRDDKEIRGLESIDDQLGLLDRLSPKAQRTFLMVTLDEAAGIGDEIDEVVSAWRAGDMSVLEDEFLGPLQEQAELYESIVVARNRSWVKPVVALTDDRQDYLVVVGTLHLVGPDSLIRMLAQSGYQPRQVQ
jgi:uncharacterized protein YbaP (TraB family)